MVRKQVTDYSLAQALVSAAKNLEKKGVIFESAFQEVIVSEDDWFSACMKFDVLRLETLRQEKLGMSADRETVLLFQENLLKLLCMIKGNSRRFDADTSSWAIICLMHILKSKPKKVVDEISRVFLEDIAKWVK